MFNRKTAGIYLAAIFLAGLLAGGAAGFSMGKRTAFSPPRQREMASHICGRLKSNLHLTPEQVTQIEPLVQQAAAELKAVHSASADRVSEIFQRLNSKQAQYLTDEQKLLLQKMEEERQTFSRRSSKSEPGQRAKSGSNLPPCE